MSITKSQTEKIGSIFHGNKFIIPTYQRKYSWTDNERKALWQDIEESITDDMNHFIGTLSFKENSMIGLSSNKTYEIIDGQQRITTLFILLKCLIDRVPDDGVRNEQLSFFIGSQENLRIEPLGEDGEFLKALLFNFDKIDVEDINKRSQRFMYSAVRLYNALINTLSHQQVEERIVFIRDRIEVLVFNVANQAQAVRMFSIINDRGLPLRVLDKTKSILMFFSTLHLQESLNEFINNKFEIIFDSYDDILITKDKLDILRRFEENTIFTQHYYSSKRLFPKTWNTRNGANTIFENLKTKCEELKDNSEELESFIKEYLNDFEAFSKGYANLLKEIKVDRNPNYLRTFRFLEFSATLYPLIVRVYIQSKLDPLLNLFETIEVRVYKLRGLILIQIFIS